MHLAPTENTTVLTFEALLAIGALTAVAALPGLGPTLAHLTSAAFAPRAEVVGVPTPSPAAEVAMDSDSGHHTLTPADVETLLRPQ
jgi:hypothetical protein